MKLRTWMTTAIGLGGLSWCLQGTPAWAASQPSSSETIAAPSQSASPQMKDDRATFVQAYQQREQAAQTQKNFEGGGAGLYIGGSTAAIVLLLVILIVVL